MTDSAAGEDVREAGTQKGGGTGHRQGTRRRSRGRLACAASPRDSGLGSSPAALVPAPASFGVSFRTKAGPGMTAPVSRRGEMTHGLAASKGAGEAVGVRAQFLVLSWGGFRSFEVPCTEKRMGPPPLPLCDSNNTSIFLSDT